MSDYDDEMVYDDHDDYIDDDAEFDFDEIDCHDDEESASEATPAPTPASDSASVPISISPQEASEPELLRLNGNNLDVTTLFTPNSSYSSLPVWRFNQNAYQQVAVPISSPQESHTKSAEPAQEPSAPVKNIDLFTQALSAFNAKRDLSSFKAQDARGRVARSMARSPAPKVVSDARISTPTPHPVATPSLPQKRVMEMGSTQGEATPKTQAPNAIPVSSIILELDSHAYSVEQTMRDVSATATALEISPSPAVTYQELPQEEDEPDRTTPWFLPVDLAYSNEELSHDPISCAPKVTILYLNPYDIESKTPDVSSNSKQAVELPPHLDASTELKELTMTPASPLRRARKEDLSHNLRLSQAVSSQGQYTLHDVQAPSCLLQETVERNSLSKINFVSMDNQGNVDNTSLNHLIKPLPAQPLVNDSQWNTALPCLVEQLALAISPELPHGDQGSLTTYALGSPELVHSINRLKPSPVEQLAHTLDFMRVSENILPQAITGSSINSVLKDKAIVTELTGIDTPHDHVPQDKTSPQTSAPKAKAQSSTPEFPEFKRFMSNVVNFVQNSTGFNESNVPDKIPQSLPLASKTTLYSTAAFSDLSAAAKLHLNTKKQALKITKAQVTAHPHVATTLAQGRELVVGSQVVPAPTVDKTVLTAPSAVVTETSSTMSEIEQALTLELQQRHAAAADLDFDDLDMLENEYDDGDDDDDEDYSLNEHCDKLPPSLDIVFTARRIISPELVELRNMVRNDSRFQDLDRFDELTEHCAQTQYPYGATQGPTPQSGLYQGPSPSPATMHQTSHSTGGRPHNTMAAQHALRSITALPQRYQDAMGRNAQYPSQGQHHGQSQGQTQPWGNASHTSLPPQGSPEYPENIHKGLSKAQRFLAATSGHGQGQRQGVSQPRLTNYTRDIPQGSLDALGDLGQSHEANQGPSASQDLPHTAQQEQPAPKTSASTEGQPLQPTSYTSQGYTFAQGQPQSGANVGHGATHSLNHVEFKAYAAKVASLEQAIGQGGEPDAHGNASPTPSTSPVLTSSQRLQAANQGHSLSATSCPKDSTPLSNPSKKPEVAESADRVAITERSEGQDDSKAPEASEVSETPWGMTDTLESDSSEAPPVNVMQDDYCDDSALCPDCSQEEEENDIESTSIDVETVLMPSQMRAQAMNTVIDAPYEEVDESSLNPHDAPAESAEPSADPMVNTTTSQAPLSDSLNNKEQAMAQTTTTTKTTLGSGLEPPDPEVLSSQLKGWLQDRSKAPIPTAFTEHAREAKAKALAEVEADNQLFAEIVQNPDEIQNQSRAYELYLKYRERNFTTLMGMSPELERFLANCRQTEAEATQKESVAKSGILSRFAHYVGQGFTHLLGLNHKPEVVGVLNGSDVGGNYKVANIGKQTGATTGSTTGSADSTVGSSSTAATSSESADTSSRENKILYLEQRSLKDLDALTGIARKSLLQRLLSKTVSQVALSLGGLALAFFAVAALIYNSRQNTMIPYLVTVDSHGVVVNNGEPELADEIPIKVVTAQLCDFIRNIRTFTTDPTMQRQVIIKAYSYVKPGTNAAVQLNNYYRGNNPFTTPPEEALLIKIANAIETSDKTFQIDWAEETLDKKTVQLLRAQITYSVHPLDRESTDNLLLNPLGIFIENLVFSSLLEKDLTPISPYSAESTALYEQKNNLSP